MSRDAAVTPTVGNVWLPWLPVPVEGPQLEAIQVPVRCDDVAETRKSLRSDAKRRCLHASRMKVAVATSLSHTFTLKYFMREVLRVGGGGGGQLLSQPPTTGWQVAMAGRGGRKGGSGKVPRL